MKNFARKNVDPFTMKILTKKIRKIQFQQKRQLGKLQFTARIVQKKVARRTLRNFLENDFWTPPLLSILYKVVIGHVAERWAP